MRDTSDMMEDALSEDTMMDCGGDTSGPEDFVDLASDSADSSQAIRDAAERLLTMLGVDDDREFLSSSEDEGVEVDVDDEFDDDEEDVPNTRLLHQLAMSLAQELKYSRQKQNPSPTTTLQDRFHFEARHHQAESIDMTQETSYRVYNYPHGQSDITTEPPSPYYANDFPNQNGGKYTMAGFHQQHQNNSLSKEMPSMDSLELACLNRRLGLDQFEEAREVRSSSEDEQASASWSAGWDACATEALRYLIEDEGLPPHHPTVLAMKNHLELQRERAFVQYAA